MGRCRRPRFISRIYIPGNKVSEYENGENIRTEKRPPHLAVRQTFILLSFKKRRECLSEKPSRIAPAVI